MNETIGEYIYEYEDISFKIFVPDYWTRIYKGQARKKLYHDYCVMLDQVKKIYRGKWIVDVGVNHGIFAVPASIMGYKVLGFEPVKSNFQNIQQARVENQLVNFDIFNLALSDENGQKEIYVPQCKDNASFSQDAAIANMKQKEFEVEKVECVKLDDWIVDNPDYSNIGLIKIDVQGYEVNVLLGMKEFLSNAHDIYIIAEYENHLNKMGHTFEELDGLFHEYGFKEQPKILNGDKLFYKP